MQIFTNSPRPAGKRTLLPICPNCHSYTQVWINQISGELTCHRARCGNRVFTARELAIYITELHESLRTGADLLLDPTKQLVPATKQPADWDATHQLLESKFLDKSGG